MSFAHHQPREADVGLHVTALLRYSEMCNHPAHRFYVLASFWHEAVKNGMPLVEGRKTRTPKRNKDTHQSDTRDTRTPTNW